MDLNLQMKWTLKGTLNDSEISAAETLDAAPPHSQSPKFGRPFQWLIPCFREGQVPTSICVSFFCLPPNEVVAALAREADFAAGGVRSWRAESADRAAWQNKEGLFSPWDIN